LLPENGTIFRLTGRGEPKCKDRSNYQKDQKGTVPAFDEQKVWVFSQNDLKNRALLCTRRQEQGLLGGTKRKEHFVKHPCIDKGEGGD